MFLRGKELTHWKRRSCWEGLKAEEKGAAEDEGQTARLT